MRINVEHGNKKSQQRQRERRKDRKKTVEYGCCALYDTPTHVQMKVASVNSPCICVNKYNCDTTKAKRIVFYSQFGFLYVRQCDYTISLFQVIFLRLITIKEELWCISYVVRLCWSKNERSQLYTHCQRMLFVDPKKKKKKYSQREKTTHMK